MSAAGVTTCLGAGAGNVASLTAAVAFGTAARVEGGGGNVGAFSRLKIRYIRKKLAKPSHLD